MVMQSIADGWRQVKFGDVCGIKGGYAFKSSEFRSRGVPVIKIGQIQNGAILFDKRTSFVDKDSLDTDVAKNFIVKRGDILIAMTGATIGKIGEFRHGIAFLNQRVGKFEPHRSVDKKFIYFLSQTRDFYRSIVGNVLASAQGNISPKKIENIDIIIPPLSEQKAIAHVLTTVQDAIAAQESLILKLKELKRSMMQRLFTHGTKGEKTKMTEIGEIPESWEVASLGELCEVKGGKRLPKGEKLVSENTGLPYVRVTDFTNNSVRLSDILYLKQKTQKVISRYTIGVSDIYISIAGSIGLVGIIPDELDGANLTENAAKLCLKNDDIGQKFLMYWLVSDLIQKEIKSQTVKNAQPKLALARIQKIPCIIPCVEEQEKITGILSGVDNKINVFTSKLSVYKNLFKTLLHELMSGIRRVNI